MKRIVFISFALIVAIALIILSFILSGKDSGAKGASAGSSSTSTTSATTTSASESTTTTTEEVDSMPSSEIDNLWAYYLVNADNPLPSDFEIETTKIYEDREVDKRVAPFLLDMLSDAKADGIHIKVQSAYRSTSYQQMLYDMSIERYMEKDMTREEATAATAKELALPGTSEHNAGLAVDLNSRDAWELTESFENTEEFKWLKENSYKYGFILRYPKDKVNITGIIYEPWHYRFIGIHHATKLTESGLCLEEYMAKYPK